MDEVKELKKYKCAKEFAKAHGKKIDVEDDPTWGELLGTIARSGINRAAQDIAWEIESQIDPLGLFYTPSKGAIEEGKKREILEEQDDKRPEIQDHLSFRTMPKEKAEGLHARIALFAKSWNQFVDEIKDGNVEMAEVVVVAYDDVDWSDDEEEYYVKVADLDGRVLKGGIRKIRYSRLNLPYDEDLGGWLLPEDYKDRFSGRTKEEYNLYEAVYRANAYADVVDTSGKPHAYVLHFKRKKKEYYGLITQGEYEDLKQLKDYITFMKPEYCFKPENNHGLYFDW